MIYIFLTLIKAFSEPLASTDGVGVGVILEEIPHIMAEMLHH